MMGFFMVYFGKSHILNLTDDLQCTVPSKGKIKNKNIPLQFA